MRLTGVGICVIALVCPIVLGCVAGDDRVYPETPVWLSRQNTHQPCRSTSSMSESNLVLQYVMYGKHTWGTRVFANGHVDEYSDQIVDFTEDGDFKTRSVPLEWRSRTQLSADEMRRLNEAIRRSDILTLPTRLEPAGTVRDGSTTVWTIELDGKRHEITARGTEQARHPTLEALRSEFEEIVADALNRDEPAPPTNEEQRSNC